MKHFEIKRIATEIMISIFERAIAEGRSDLAAERYFKAHGTTESATKISINSNRTINMIGNAGELAFCKIFNLCPNLDENNLSHDVCLYRGERCDIKTVPREGQALRVPRSRIEEMQSKAIEPPECYALMFCKALPFDADGKLIDIERAPLGPFSFCGFMSFDELIKEERFNSAMKEPCYEARWNELSEYIAIFEKGE